ncbi:hypothetical protein PTKIN_Ptkin17bG0120300 [Pterospermum kingtungense]
METILSYLPPSLSSSAPSQWSWELSETSTVPIRDFEDYQKLEGRMLISMIFNHTLFLVGCEFVVCRLCMRVIWKRQLKIERLIGVDSDFAPFLQHVGVPSLRGELYVASCSATKIYIDLDIPETRQLKQMHENERIKVEILPPYNECRQAAANTQETREATIADLLSFKPETIHNVKFSCQAKVIDVDPSTGWFYNACNQCYKSLHPRGQSFHCANHGEKTPILTMKLNMTIEDKSGQMELLAFAKPTEKLINSTVSKIASNGTLDKMTLPPPVIKIIDREFIFQIGLTQQAMKQNFLAYKIFSSEVFMNKLPAQPTMPTDKQVEIEASIQPSLLTPEKNQHEETTLSQHITNIPEDLFLEESPTKKMKIRVRMFLSLFKV